MSLFTWLFKDEAEVIKERLAQAYRDNRALERKLDELKERVRSLETNLRDLTKAQLYQDGMIERLTPKQTVKESKPVPTPQDYRYVNDSGPDLSTVMLVSAMCAPTPSHNEDYGWTSSYRDSTFSDSPSSSCDSSSSSSCDSSSSSSCD